MLEVSASDIAEKLAGEQPLWEDVRAEGLVVHGLEVIEREGLAGASGWQACGR